MYAKKYKKKIKKNKYKKYIKKIKKIDDLSDNSSDSSSESVISIRSTISIQSVKKIIQNQDFIQYSTVLINISYELYRIIVSTLLILSIPQNCNGQICTITQNMSWENRTHNIAVCFNFFTLFIFAIHYYIEIKRENYLIYYLEVNSHNPRDNESLDAIFELLPYNNKLQIYDIDFYYHYMTYVVFVLFILNYIISCISIYEKSLGYQTAILVLTYMLFMGTKVYHLYYITSKPKNIFYSAYLLDRIQFNDVSTRLKEQELIQIHCEKVLNQEINIDNYCNSDDI